MKRNTIHSQGFTLVELVIVMAIMGMLFSLGVARYVDFNRRQSVVTAGLKLKNDLRSIQQKALSGVRPTSGCGTLDGYLVNFRTTDFGEFYVCDTPDGVTSVPPPDYLDPTKYQLYPLPVNFEYEATDTIFFKVLGTGVTIHDSSGALSGVAAQIVTIKAYTSPEQFYSLCVAGGGDIKDCGYASGGAPVCSCP